MVNNLLTTQVHVVNAERLELREIHDLGALTVRVHPTLHDDILVGQVLEQALGQHLLVVVARGRHLDVSQYTIIKRCLLQISHSLFVGSVFFVREYFLRARLDQYEAGDARVFLEFMRAL